MYGSHANENIIFTGKNTTKGNDETRGNMTDFALTIPDDHRSDNENTSSRSNQQEPKKQHQEHVLNSNNDGKSGSPDADLHVANTEPKVPREQKTCAFMANAGKALGQTKIFATVNSPGKTHSSERPSMNRNRLSKVDDSDGDGDGDSVEDGDRYECTKTKQQPIRASASNKLTSWQFDMTGFATGIYDIILGVSAEGLNLDHIESIAFNIERKSGVVEPTERLSGQDLAALCLAKSTSDTEVVKWKLHVQVRKFAKNILDDLVDLKMLITERGTLDRSTTPVVPGFLELHFMALRPFRREGYPYDSYLRTHLPYIWSINVGQIVEVADGSSHHLPKRIIHFAISGDGNYAATLSAAKADLLLELWNLRAPNNLKSHSRVSTESIQQRDLQRAAPAPFHPQLSAAVRIPFAAPPEGHLEDSYSVSVSWNSSNIALTDASKAYRTESDTQSLFAVYNHQLISSPNSVATSGSSATRIRSYNIKQDLQGLKNFYGYGKFHFKDAKHQNPQKELFVACGGMSVEVYKVLPRWWHIGCIPLNQPCDDIAFGLPSARKLIRTLRGEHFAWSIMKGNSEAVTVWSLETGCMKLLHWKKGNDIQLNNKDAIAFPARGPVMAIGHQKVITTYCSRTGALCGSFRMPECCETIVDMAFICSDTQILVIAEGGDDFNNGKRVGLILDAASLTIASRFTLINSWRSERTEITFDDNIFCALESSLDCVHLKHLQQHSQPWLVCGTQCKSKLAKLNRLPTEIGTPSGMQFKIEIGPGVIVSASTSSKSTCRVLTFPNGNPGRGFEWKYRCARILEGYSRLVVISDTVVTIWGLPATPDDVFTLLLAWKKLDADAFWDSECDSWYICPHGQVYAEEDKSEQDKTFFCPRTERVFCGDATRRFLMALDDLAHMFVQGDQICRDAILRYVGSHINSYPDPDNRSVSVLTYICQNWEHHHDYEQFLKALLGSRYGRWIPLFPRFENDFTVDTQEQQDRESDPLYVLVNMALKEKRAIGMAEIIVSYCVQQAKIEGDRQFLSSFTQCLFQLFGQDQVHLEFTMKTLRRLAFIPVSNNSFIMDHHTIVARPPNFRRQFGESETRRRHEYVLQWDNYAQAHCSKKDMTSSLLASITCPILYSRRRSSGERLNNDNFKHELFMAPFEMLWRSNANSTRARAILFLPRRLFKLARYAMGHKTNVSLKRKKAVDIHEFTLEAFDNPAIAALIEFKWNAIGFKFWLLRFAYQCGFYLLVLVAVFIPIFSDQYRPLTGLHVVIIFGSSCFLWRERLQFRRDRQKYISSVYNWVDLATFGLTSAGSIHQLILDFGYISEGKHNIGLLSFSVLFVFLHFLFELRVTQSVCRFVVIITQVISKIRVFFIVFAGGVLAFTIAIMHLLRGCISSNCQAPTTNFPGHFYGAISATYFFMGGRYDPISDELGSDNWAFHTMMIVYFFFTVIIMLNVLIALINVAFNHGDETWLLVWQENRLHYIYAAEKLSYGLPGFRNYHKDWFPKEIYYSARPEQIRAYNKKYPEAGEDTDMMGGSQDLFDVLPSGKAFAASAAAFASYSTSPSNENPASSAAISKEFRAAKDAVLAMGQGVSAQLKSIQLQQTQQQAQMECFKLEMRTLLLQLESIEQRAVVQENRTEAGDSFLLSREQLDEKDILLQGKLDRQLQEHSVLFQKHISRQQESFEMQVRKLHELFSTHLGQAAPPS